MPILPLALSAQEWGLIVGILGAPATITGAVVAWYKAKPETQTLVMSSGETGVKILDSVIDTLQTELARRDLAIEALEARLDRRTEYLKAEQATYRAIIEERETEIRRLHDIIEKQHGL